MQAGWFRLLQDYASSWNRSIVKGKGEDILKFFLTKDAGKKEVDRLNRLQEGYRERDATPKKSETQVQNIHLVGEEVDRVKAHVEVYQRQIYQQKQALFDQEEKNWLKFQLVKKGSDWLIAGYERLEPEGDPQGRESAIVPDWQTDGEAGERLERATYNREKAVRYAEAWWNRHNPDYRAFDVDCTNYVSQCLHAGGVPMEDTGKRDRGWWYRGSGKEDDSWSYSWSVAHSLCWYLLTSRKGLCAEERKSAKELSPGDVICYDFDGNGHWQHNTIVVAKDENGMPLVNAHTTNSRRRYWDYKDSHAWTPQIQYKFFHIVVK